MPALQCPECGEKHALDGLGHSASFRCRGCRRLLKVPERFRAPTLDGSDREPVAPAAPVAPSGAPPHDATSALPPAPRRAATPSASSVNAEPPLWMRFVIWVVALPVGFLLVFGAAKTLGFLTSRQLVDTFIERGWDRFGALGRLLPFWALVTAVIVHLSVTGLTRWRESRRAGREGDAPRHARAEREPARVS